MGPKTILLTGATDGIGLATAHVLAADGHRLLLHGRDDARLARTERALRAVPGAGPVECHRADLSRPREVLALADAVAAWHARLDVLILNAGVFRAPHARTPEGLDVRFAVNALAPMLLTQRLRPQLRAESRIVAVSSAAQAPVDLDALAGRTPLDDMAAYAQSKLALTMWVRWLARTLGDAGPIVVAVNPGSMLGSKMVREGFGVAGGDVRVGAAALARAALADDFAAASGRYFDNDAGRFGTPHRDALDDAKVAAVVDAMQRTVQTALGASEAPP